MIDDLIPIAGQPTPGLDGFTAALDHAGIPSVWLTSRTRLQLDAPRRKVGQSHPFVAEDGCGVYLPQDYFHLRPSGAGLRQGKPTTLRLGRFTCVPVAEPQPAAADALEALSRETGAHVVPLRTLSPRETAQNLNLPVREADFARQRDFDELFFFAGASEQDIGRFRTAGRSRNVQLRQHEAWLSLAVGANLSRCIRELSSLYDRALRGHALTVGVSTLEGAEGIRPACDRYLLLTREQGTEGTEALRRFDRSKQIPFDAPDLWEQLLSNVAPRKL